MTPFWNLNHYISMLTLILPGEVFTHWLKELPSDSIREVQTQLPCYYFIKGPTYLRTNGCYLKGERGVRVGRNPGLSVAQEPFRPCDSSLWMLPATRRGQRPSHGAVPAPLLGPFAPLALPSELASRWLWALGPALP